MMQLRPLTLADRPQWADLLALSFDRSPDKMACLLDWLHGGHEVMAYGVWDGERLAAQYACLLVSLHLSESPVPIRAGMSLNMSVHPDYRGRGLIKQVSKPVYEVVIAAGGSVGMGFSNADGVKVDRKSKGYGYRVVGRMQPTVAWFPPIIRRTNELTLTDICPAPFPCVSDSPHIRFTATHETVIHRYMQHPFRRYRYAVWREGSEICGVVIYRPARFGAVQGVTLLAAYGYDLPQLLRRFAGTMRGVNVHFAHILTTPHSPLCAALMQAAVCVPQPISRSPYYLTVKPLCDDTPAALFDFAAWDCMGGDIL